MFNNFEKEKLRFVKIIYNNKKRKNRVSNTIIKEYYLLSSLPPFENFHCYHDIKNVF